MDKTIKAVHKMGSFLKTRDAPKSIGSFLNSFIKRNFSIIVTGFVGAGKSTILRQLELGEIFETVPTIGLSIETVKYKNILINAFDTCIFPISCVFSMHRREKIVPILKKYYNKNNGLIFVIDSTDDERMYGKYNIKKELDELLAENELKNIPLLIFANKQNMKNAYTIDHIKKYLELSLIKDRPWFIQGTSGDTGNGVNAGLDWLMIEILKAKQFV